MLSVKDLRDHEHFGYFYLETDRDRWFNAAAFFGGLFAMGIIRFERFGPFVRSLINSLKYPSQYQALCLILVHSRARISEDLPQDWLRECRKLLQKKQADLRDDALDFCRVCLCLFPWRASRN